ncbi:hypothetical protein SAMN04488515_0076 [Cognatiyoonia koreensis]|uniref:Uncharacterized protein n=1 Tax=Cognatiyoonia koreensis TaxID=364200 RepID=A0A1I0MMK0_9RHOB|nr:hypothetical protein SAMN04488515_0076 [Cognatiyoonia koreensis]
MPLLTLVALGLCPYNARHDVFAGHANYFPGALTRAAGQRC